VAHQYVYVDADRKTRNKVHAQVMYQDDRNLTLWHPACDPDITPYCDCKFTCTMYACTAYMDPDNLAITLQLQLLLNAQENGVQDDTNSGPKSNHCLVSGFQTITTRPEEDVENCHFPQSPFSDSGNSVLATLPRLLPY
jgi:hypothetical protein